MSYLVSKDYLFSVPVPMETRTYKPISHREIVELTLESIYAAGMTVQDETYTCARDGMVANGRYKISSLKDGEMQLQIAFQNSYDKSLSFKFAIGANVIICSNGLVVGDIGKLKKKHTGTIKEFAPRKITEFVKLSSYAFDDLVGVKEDMKKVGLSKRRRAELLGRMYIEHDIINSTQLNIIKDELIKPTYDYGHPDTFWEFYNYITFALRTSHPSNWMKSHIEATDFVLYEMGEV